MFIGESYIVNLYQGMSKLRLTINVNLPHLLFIVVSVALHGEFERFGGFCVDCYYVTFTAGLSNQNLTSRISTSRSCHSGLIFSVVCLEIGECRAQSSNEDCLRGYTCEHTWTRVEADDNMAQYLTHVIAGASEYFNSQTEMEFLLRYPNEDDIRSCERASRSLYRPVSYTKDSSAFQ